MSTLGSQAGKRVVKPRPYVIRRNKITGELYLERQRSPFWGEFPYATVLVIAVVFAAISCCGYIQTRTDVECRIRSIEKLERQVLRLKSENTLAERELSRTPELNEVYEIAITQLGMVPATEQNIILFERSNSEFVYQTANVPHFGS